MTVAARFIPYVTRKRFGWERRCPRCQSTKSLAGFQPHDLFCWSCATEVDRVSLDDRPALRQLSGIGIAVRPLPRVMPSAREFLGLKSGMVSPASSDRRADTGEPNRVSFP